MKFSDIPRLTKSAGWVAQYMLSYVPKTIEKWVNDEHYALQLNPDFQRGHVWTIEQRIAYVEYILRGGEFQKRILFNKPSWNGCASTGYDDMVCVDGLQRLTSIIMFLNNELSVFGGNYYKDFEGRMSSLITMEFGVNNLQTKAEVLNWYLELNTAGTPHTDEEICRVQEMLRLEREKEV